MCEIEDIQLLEDQTLYWGVDEDGNPTDHLDSTDADFKAYICECGEEFDGVHYEFNMEKAWVAVLEHLKEHVCYTLEEIDEHCEQCGKPMK